MREAVERLRFAVGTDGAGVTPVLDTAGAAVLIDPADTTGTVSPETEQIDILISVVRPRVLERVARLCERLTAADGPPRITVWCPPGADGRVPTLLSTDDAAIDVRRADPGPLLQAGPCAVHAYSTSHAHHSLGYVVYPSTPSNGPDPVRATLVYAGFTRPCYATVEAARGARLLVHDANYISAEAPEARQQGHSTGAEAARVAAAAEVGELLLMPTRRLGDDEADRMQEEAGRLFRPVRLATAGMSVDLPAGAMRRAVRAAGL